MSDRSSGGPLDETDEAIIRLLERDGRLTHREIASRVGLSRSAAAARVQRLLEEAHVDVRGAVHPAVLGHDVLVHLSLAVRGSVVEVARQVAERDDAPFVSLTAGRFPLVVELRAAGIRELEGAVAAVRDLRGVDAVETLVYTEVLRDVAGPVGPVAATPDETDIALLRALQVDGRASYVDLAAAVGLSAPGARRRVLRLRESNVVRIGAVVRHSGRERRSATGVGLRVEGPPREVGRSLLELDDATFVACTLGRFDVLLTVSTATAGDLVELLDRLRTHPGVRDLESWSHLRFAKESYASLHLGETPLAPVSAAGAGSAGAPATSRGRHRPPR